MCKKTIVNNKQLVLYYIYFAIHNLHYTSVNLYICQSQVQFFLLLFVFWIIGS